MTPTQKEIASVEEFEKTLIFESPIPVSWAISKYKAQHELIELLTNCTQEEPCRECLKKSVEGWKLIADEQAEEIKQLREEQGRNIHYLKEFRSRLTNDSGIYKELCKRIENAVTNLEQK